MIVLFTDYGLQGPYIGEVEAKLFRYAPSERVVNLMADVPRQNVQAAAYLLAALSMGFPRGTTFFCVVDPGVGSSQDQPVLIRMGEHRFVGPHNGQFDMVARRGDQVDCWQITWQPEMLSSSFHGRDLYAPVCAMIANQQPVPGRKFDWRPRYDWPDDLAEVIYFDGFGNAWTGIRAETLAADRVITVADQQVKNADTFAKVARGEYFWYANSSGMVEIAVNQGSAREVLGLVIGSKIRT
jgi:S-adenosyl-L-methionine hydrolase (adenosine-forming)